MAIETNNTRKGIIMAVVAATLWGISGTCGQFLFQQREISVEWLMSVRMLGAGGLLLVFALAKKDKDVRNIWLDKPSRSKLLMFGIFGMLTVQYTYFAAIKFSNAATATILQFSAPVMIAIYLAIRHGQRLVKQEYLAISLAVLGTILLVTHGNLGALNISSLAFGLGMASAVSLATYTLLPVPLLKKFSAVSVIGWGLFIGGVAISLVKAPWRPDGIWDIYTYANTLFVVIFGTLFPFYLYLQAVHLIGGQKASVLTSAEPLSATLISVVILGLSFKFMDWIGALLIIATVFILSMKKTNTSAGASI
ncbi:EamA family transporter [Mucilaginibacter sp. 21P]|uniref:DMT family transporter n=1 Tax=Mucilaginibacter sp. 21P TaxID=2778902 RepID=UPI001C5A4FE0|nr:EamA family transporter [Mucilaginibacter sp. 21P]QXV66168.1 EamA family transporter [Mucilaginibacter sp. 21P]